jgi:pimeloyl-ACP methyl ester carboxylesterase
VRRLVVIDGYAGEGSVAERSATAERERAFDRVRDRPWFEPALEAFDATIDSRSMSEEELVSTFIRCLPLYFADPESDVAIAHIDRLRREFRWNIDVTDRWDSGEPDDVVPLLPRISFRTLVMVGELDFICGPVWNRPIAEGIPGARYVEFEGVGHLPQYEAPERFRTELFAWLEES